MILIVANTYEVAKTIARERMLTYAQWRYANNEQVSRGWNPPETTILVHDQWHEKPVRKPDDDGHATYPIREGIKIMQAMGAKVSYVRT